MHPVLQDSKPFTLKTMHFNKKFEKKSGITYQCLKIKVKLLTFQYKKYVYCFHFQYQG